MHTKPIPSAVVPLALFAGTRAWHCCHHVGSVAHQCWMASFTPAGRCAPAGKTGVWRLERGSSSFIIAVGFNVLPMSTSGEDGGEIGGGGGGMTPEVV